MKSEIALSIFLIVHISFGFTLAAIFQINRARPQGSLGRQNGVDYFGMTSSICRQNSEYECSVFKALSVAQICNCSCPVEKSTFTPFENQWTCIEDSEVRTNLQSRQYSKHGEKGNIFNKIFTVSHELVSKFCCIIIIFIFKYIFHTRNYDFEYTSTCVFFVVFMLLQN